MTAVRRKRPRASGARRAAIVIDIDQDFFEAIVASGDPAFALRDPSGHRAAVRSMRGHQAKRKAAR